MDSWRFRHQLLREVAYELPPPSVRRILHSRVADALVGDSDHPDWHLVALHYEHAERFDEAANAHRQAATDARRRGALDEARACLTRAIAQIERAAPGVCAGPAGSPAPAPPRVPCVGRGRNRQPAGCGGLRALSGTRRHRPARGRPRRYPDRAVGVLLAARRPPPNHSGLGLHPSTGAHRPVAGSGV